MQLFNTSSAVIQKLPLTRLYMILLLISLGVINNASASESSPSTVDQFRYIQLTKFIDKNQLSDEMISNKQRLMLPPAAIQFDAQLMAPPKAGTFSLVYDALGLWGKGKMPTVDHSAFIGAADGRVLAVYVSQTAAKQMKTLAKNQASHFYAVHIYNYAKGPRLVIIGAETGTKAR